MSDSRYAIAVIGGATAGAEAASVFAREGISTVVFEMNARPYGKVEDGLPRWHINLRNKEYAAIDTKLAEDLVSFVPNTKVGPDIDLNELVNDWGFHSVVLANGAWRDRPVPLEGIDAYVDKGLVYQNAFIYWFNHYNEASYNGQQFEILDETMVVGGGLASIDVVKVIQLELCVQELARRGIEVDLVETEVAGIPKTLAKHDLEWSDLGIKGCTLYYRRNPEDMPLVDLPENANDKVREKIAKSRGRVLEKAMSKYLFNLEPLRAPKSPIIENDRLVGLVFSKTRIEGGRVIVTDETSEARAPMIISSIGSIPEGMAGIPMKGELYAYTNWDLGKLPDYPTLFSVGNVVTGKGNIVASRKHAKGVANYVTQEYLALAQDVKKLEPLTPEESEALMKRVQQRQEAVGYDGDYGSWIKAATPPDRV